MVTRPALDRFFPGIIAWESSSVNLRGHLPTLPRNTATGIPGASTDLATMKSVSPAVALPAKPAANVTSPLTATPDPAAGDDAVEFAPPANAGSCLARALAASAGRPRNSKDLASSSQSSGVPPPLASRASNAAMALSIEPAPGFGVPFAAPPGLAAGPLVAGPVASPNTFAAVPKAPALPDGAPAVGGEGLSATSGRTSQPCDVKNAATITIATTDPCQGAAGSDAKRGRRRSHGEITTSRASVVSTPAKNQNKAINVP